MKNHIKKFGESLNENASEYRDPSEWTEEELIQYIIKSYESLSNRANSVFFDVKKRIQQDPDFTGWRENLTDRSRKSMGDISKLQLGISSTLLNIKRALASRVPRYSDPEWKEDQSLDDN